MSSSTDRGANHGTTTQLTGEVVRPGDSGYEAARIGYNRLYSFHPEAIVFCTATQDVVNALTWAQQNDIAVRVRSGRHCLEGWSVVDDGLVIDVSQMKSAEIDAASKTATVGAGLNQLEAVTALGKAGFVGADRDRRNGRTGRRDARRWVRSAHPQFRHGIGQSRRRRGRRGVGRRRSDGNRRRRARTTQTCSGRCAAQATAVSGSSPH